MPFQTVRMCLAFEGIMPKESHHRYYPFTREYVMTNFLCGIGFISLWTYFFHVADSTKDFINSFFVLIVTCAIFISLNSIIFNVEELFGFFDHCDKFLADDSICDKNRRKLEAKLNKCEKLVEILSKFTYFVIVVIGVSAAMLPKAIASFYIRYTTDLGNDAFEFLLPLWIPFEWKNTFGYLCAFVIESVMLTYLLHHVACFVSLALGAYLFAASINEYLNSDFKSINRKIKLKNFDFDILKQQLSTFINTHMKVKQIATEFSEIYETTLTLLFCGCTCCLSISMLMIQIEIMHDESDFFMLSLSLFYGVNVFGGVFFSCELGQRFSNSFGKIDYGMAKLDWYLFPINIQRSLPMIIMNVQQPVLIKCFGNILCSRDQFKKVANTAYQYFMVLHKLYH